MKSWRKTVLIAAAAAVLGGGGVAWAAGGTTAPKPPGPGAATRGAAPAAAVDTTQESKYTPIAPCRVVDTRRKGGALVTGATRAFYVDGAGSTFADQGGHADGCGIPSSASAIQATVTAVSATGNGSLKAYPAGATAPTATFMNYTKTFNVSNGGSITLCGSKCAADINITNSGYTTHIVIDVQGYYVKPMWVSVKDDAAGTILAGSRVVKVEPLNTGIYVVHFDRDVSKCGYSLSPSWPARYSYVTVHGGDGVYVALYYNDQFIAAPFFLSVTC